MDSKGNTRDRHSKVLTSRGFKDRRIRLSSETALKFYYVHHMLGFNQPTKSIDWLLHHAQPAIEDLFLQSSPATFEDLKFEADGDLIPPELAWFDDQFICSPPSSHVHVGNPSQEEEEEAQQSRNDEDEDQRRQKLQKKECFSKPSESKPGWRESMRSKGIAVERRAKARERARERSKHKNNNQTSLYSGQRRTTSEFCESVGESNVQNWHGLGFPEETLGNTHLLPRDQLIAVQDSSFYSDHTFSQNPAQSAHSNCMVSSMVFSGFPNTCYDLEPSPLELENGFYNP